MRLHHLLILALLSLTACGDFDFDWKRSVHDSLSSMCDTQSNCEND